MHAGDALGFGITVLAIVVALWEIAWKAVALWKAARRDQLTWYILLLNLNTAGILPIIYIFALAPRHPELGSPTQASGGEG